jgi:hypothetical protein
VRKFFTKIVKEHGLKYDLTPCDIDSTEFKSDHTQKAFLAVNFAVHETKKELSLKKFILIVVSIEILLLILLILGVK